MNTECISERTNQLTGDDLKGTHFDLPAHHPFRVVLLISMLVLPYTIAPIGYMAIFRFYMFIFFMTVVPLIFYFFMTHYSGTRVLWHLCHEKMCGLYYSITDIFLLLCLLPQVPILSHPQCSGTDRAGQDS